MMKLIIGVFALAAAINIASAQMHCAVPNPDIPTTWIGVNEKGRGENCLLAMRKHIQTQFNASLNYLVMGAFFSRDDINRPGFAEFFFKSAKEEHQRGSKLIEYLSMRGQLTDSVTNLITLHNVPTVEWVSGTKALQDALEFHTKVGKSILDLIKTCEKAMNWYHLVKYLTGVFLDEQLAKQRLLAGKLSTLKKMTANHGAVGEFLFDKQNI